MSERDATPDKSGPRRAGRRKTALGRDSRTGAYVPVEKARKGGRAIETSSWPATAERHKQAKAAREALLIVQEGMAASIARSVAKAARSGLGAAVEIIESKPIEGPLEEVIAAKLGGEAVLHRPVKTAADIVELVRAGLPLPAFDKIRISGRFTEKELQTVIPSRTLRHRRTKRERLTVEESDKAIRLLRIQTLADTAFGNTRKADRWLRRSHAAFGGTTPLEMAAMEAGARIVETVLAKIAWGAAA